MNSWQCDSSRLELLILIERTLLDLFKCRFLSSAALWQLLKGEDQSSELAEVFLRLLHILGLVSGVILGQSLGVFVSPPVSILCAPEGIQACSLPVPQRSSGKTGRVGTPPATTCKGFSSGQLGAKVFLHTVSLDPLNTPSRFVDASASPSRSQGRLHGGGPVSAEAWRRPRSL